LKMSGRVGATVANSIQTFGRVSTAEYTVNAVDECPARGFQNMERSAWMSFMLFTKRAWPISGQSTRDPRGKPGRCQLVIHA
jgi:hypothetical protein